MAIQVSGTEVISNARALNNIASVDATTAASITAAGVGGGTWTVLGTSGNLGTLSAGSGVSSISSFVLPVGCTDVSLEVAYDVSLLQNNTSAALDVYISTIGTSGSLSSIGSTTARSSTIAGTFNGTFKTFFPLRSLITYVDDPSTNTMDGINNAGNNAGYINRNLSDGRGNYIQPTDSAARNIIRVISKISGTDSVPWGTVATVNPLFLQWFAGQTVYYRLNNVGSYSTQNNSMTVWGLI